MAKWEAEDMDDRTVGNANYLLKEAEDYPRCMLERSIISQKMTRRHELDTFLEEQSLCRKRIPDKDSLYRCISEQVYGAQNRFLHVKKCFFEYVISNHPEVLALRKGGVIDETLVDQVVNMIAKVFSKFYRINIIVYKEWNNPEKTLFEFECEDGIERCKTFNHQSEIQMTVDCRFHWDCVYSQEHMSDMGHFQAEVYGILYKSVFDLENVDEAVAAMLDKNKKFHLKELRNLKSQSELIKLALGDFSEYEHEKDLIVLVKDGIPPFPYKVAKCLESSIYRNVLYDAWDIENGDRIRGPDELLQVGCKCVVHLKENIKCFGYVQMLYDGKESALVYIEQLGEIREVPKNILQVALTASGLPLGHHRQFGFKTKRNQGSKSKIIEVPNTEYSEAIPSNDESNIEEEAFPEETEEYSEAATTEDQLEAQGATSLHESNSTLNLTSSFPMAQYTSQNFVVGDEPILEDRAPQPYIDTSPNTYSGEDTTVSETTRCDETEQYTEASDEQVSQEPIAYLQNYPAHEQYMPLYSQQVSYIPSYSAAPDGNDLPFHDVPLLRFYYNRGIQASLEEGANYEIFQAPSVGSNIEGVTNGVNAILLNVNPPSNHLPLTASAHNAAQMNTHLVPIGSLGEPVPVEMVEVPLPQNQFYGDHFSRMPPQMTPGDMQYDVHATDSTINAQGVFYMTDSSTSTQVSPVNGNWLNGTTMPGARPDFIQIVPPFMYPPPNIVPRQQFYSTHYQN